MAGLFLGAAWIFPGEKTGAIFCILSAILFCVSVLKSEIKLQWIYAGGVLSHAIAFSWLFHTIADFGGFGVIPAGLIFGLFLAVSALQFPLAAWIARKIDKDLMVSGLAVTAAWCFTEFVVFRLFPWGYGHSLIGFASLVQIADIGGSLLVTFLLFWVAETLVRYFILNQKSPVFLGAAVFLVFAVSYGRFRIQQFTDFPGTQQKIAVIQANVSVEEKHNQSLIVANTERYKELSKDIPGPDTLIIWPESVINDFIFNNVASVGNDARLPFFDSFNPLLLGSLSYNEKEDIFNSSFAILNSGTVLEPYHKQILMPFGEFMPLSKTFPWIKKLNPLVADFTAGTSEKVFEYPMIRGDDSFYTARVSPLICYEDVVASPARNSVLMGAEILVNLTNDGWFGQSLAPFQHNQIASFRAVENRRFLVRSTNTGLTSLISPTGITEQTLPIFSEGILNAQIPLINYMTLYSAYVGDWFGWILVVVVLTLLVTNLQSEKIFRRKKLFK